MPQYHIPLNDTQIGHRLDAALAAHLPGHSRVQIQNWIKDGHVAQDNGTILRTASLKLKVPMNIVIDAPDSPTLELVADASLTLPILYEDDALLVINKPTGVPVHPGAGHWQGTLVHALLAHTKGALSDGSEEGRPGIVHRLDKDTSGAMVVAKTNEAHFLLSKALQERTVKRVYQALVWGMPTPLRGTVDTQIGRDARHRQRMHVPPTGGKHAVTHYHVTQVFRISDEITVSLMECTLETGRTHQIRVHATHIGHPVIGDKLYGERANARYLKKLPQDLQDYINALPGQALHARQLSFDHPTTQEPHSFTADAPQTFQNLLDALQAHYSA